MFEHQEENAPSIETLSTESPFLDSCEQRQLSLLAISRIPVVLYHRGKHAVNHSLFEGRLLISNIAIRNIAMTSF